MFQPVLCYEVLPLAVVFVRAAFQTYISLFCEEKRSLSKIAMYLSACTCPCAPTKKHLRKQLWKFSLEDSWRDKPKTRFASERVAQLQVAVGLLGGGEGGGRVGSVLYIPCLISHVCFESKTNTFCFVVYKWMVEATGYLFTEMKEYLYGDWCHIWYNASVEMVHYQCAGESLAVMLFVPAP